MALRTSSPPGGSLIYQLQGTVSMPSDLQLCSLMEKALRGRRDVEATVSAWRCSGPNGSQGTYASLYERLMDEVHRSKEFKQANANVTNGGGKGDKGGKDPGGKGLKGPKGKGGKAGKGPGGKGPKGKPGAWQDKHCDPAHGGCGKTGHLAKDCWLNPKSPKFGQGPRPPAAAQQPPQQPAAATPKAVATAVMAQQTQATPSDASWNTLQMPAFQQWRSAHACATRRAWRRPYRARSSPAQLQQQTAAAAATAAKRPLP